MFPKFAYRLLSYRALLWEVGGFSPWGWMPAFFFFHFYYCLLGVLSNLCSWANFYDWCGILQKLLSAKLLSVIPQNFSWWQIPGDWSLPFKGPQGEWDRGCWIMYSALQRQIASFGEEAATSYPSPTKLFLPWGHGSPVYEHFPRQNENVWHVQGSKIFQTSFCSK